MTEPSTVSTIGGGWRSLEIMTVDVAMPVVRLGVMLWEVVGWRSSPLPTPLGGGWSLKMGSTP